MPIFSLPLVLSYAFIFTLINPVCLANEAPTPMATKITATKQQEIPASVELQPSAHKNKTFKPSTQVNYNETVTIKAPPPEEEERQAIPVKRFGWLRLESKPLNPTQQNR